MQRGIKLGDGAVARGRAASIPGCRTPLERNYPEQLDKIVLNSAAMATSSLFSEFQL
jgi:hypothetical protein